MTSGDWFLVVAVLAALCTFVSIKKFPWIPWQTIIPLFVIGFITTELSAYVLLAQAITSVIFVMAGALGEATGKLALGLMTATWAGMLYSIGLSIKSNQLYSKALQSSLGEDFKDSIPSPRRNQLRTDIEWSCMLRPFHYVRPGVEKITDLSYGDAGKRNLLDIYRPLSIPAEGCPVLLQVHGGGWIIGDKREQGLPLMYHMTQRGWVCVAINYRLSPQHHFPAHVIDIKKSIGWIRNNIAKYGGNPDFIAITGESAGGHLSALTAVTANDPEFQPGFEDVDTHLDAAVPFYGMYDLLDHTGTGLNQAQKQHMRDTVLGCDATENEQLWINASPIAKISNVAPPFFVIHGSNDSMLAAEDAEIFAAKLRAVSANPVVYAGLPGTHHGFDLVHSVRTEYTINHVSAFLEWAYARSKSS